MRENVGAAIFKLSPNPVRDFTKLIHPFKQGETIQIEILNGAGVFVKRLSFVVDNTGELRIPTENLSNGVYLMRIQFGKNTKILKLIKQQ